MIKLIEKIYSELKEIDPLDLTKSEINILKIINKYKIHKKKFNEFDKINNKIAKNY